MLKNISKLVLTLFLLLAERSALAITNDTQSWSLLTALVNLDEAKKFAVYMEAQPRVGDNVRTMERLLLRSALVYNFDPQLSVYLGYAWTPTYMNSSYEHDFKDESRVWQQLLYKHDLLGLSWQHRFRQEQRMIDNVDTVSHRFRYLLRGSLPFDQDATYGLTAYNELFLNLNDTGRGRATGYDRDRVFIGPYLKSGIVRYEAGYLGEHARRYGAEQRLINAFLISAGITY